MGKRTTPITFLAAVWARAEVFGDFRREFRAEGRWLVSFILDNKDAQKDQINKNNWMTVIPQGCGGSYHHYEFVKNEGLPSQDQLAVLAAGAKSWAFPGTRSNRRSGRDVKESSQACGGQGSGNGLG